MDKDKFNEYLKQFTFGKLTKISDDVFDGNHPNGINEGSTISGIVMNFPEVGESCIVGSRYTSTITEIISNEENVIIFKTLNSTYKLEIDENK